MGSVPDPKSVELEEAYYHVRFRDPDEFSEIRTPAWASEAASGVVEGSKVRTGQRSGSDEWEVQSVLIPKEAGESTARSKAREIVEKIEG